MKLTRRPLGTYISFWVIWKTVSIVSFVLLLLGFLSGLLCLVFWTRPIAYWSFAFLCATFSVSSWLLSGSKHFIVDRFDKVRERAWQKWQDQRMQRAVLIGQFIQKIAGQQVTLFEQYPELCETEGQAVWYTHTLVVTQEHDRGLVVQVARRGNKNCVHVIYPPKEKSLAEDIVESLQRDHPADVVTLSPKKKTSRK